MTKRYQKFKQCPACKVSISPTPFNSNGKAMVCCECGYVKRVLNKPIIN